MSLRWKNLAFALALLGLAAVSAQAGSMTTILKVTARFDNATNFTPLPLAFAASGAVANGQLGVYQVDISFAVVKDVGEKGWANTLFDLGVGANSGGSNLGLDFPIGYYQIPIQLVTTFPRFLFTARISMRGYRAT